MKARAAIAKTRLGQSRTTILTVSDSIGAGQGAGPGGVTIAGARPFSFPSRMANRFAALGIPSQAESFFGNAAQAAAYGTYDPRVSSSTWTYDATRTTAGGNLFGAVSSATLSFLPGTNVDTFEIGYVAAPGKDTINVNIDGSAPATGSATINSNASLALLKSTVKPASAGSHTLNLVAGTLVGGFLLMGVKAYNSTTPAIDIVNCGWPGSTTANWNDGTFVWSPLNAIQYHAPHLTIIELGPNDWNNSVSVATSVANLQAIITTAKLSGDVLIVGPPQSNPATKASAASQAQFLAAYQSLALANNVSYVSWADRFGSWASANAAGYMFDDIHGNQIMYSDFGDRLVSMLTSA
jgi:hypothetical protein